MHLGTTHASAGTHAIFGRGCVLRRGLRSNATFHDSNTTRGFIHQVSEVTMVTRRRSIVLIVVSNAS